VQYITPQLFSSHPGQNRILCRPVIPLSESPLGTSEYLQHTASCNGSDKQPPKGPGAMTTPTLCHMAHTLLVLTQAL